MSQDSLVVWLRLQQSLARKIGIALSAHSSDSEVIGHIENENSVCKAMQSSAEHARLCAGDCGSAYSKATSANRKVDYRCHAGLRCFALPVAFGDKHLVVLGGRAFTSSSEYTRFQRRYSELEAVASGECLRSVHFASERELGEAADLIHSTVEYNFRASEQLQSGLANGAEAAPGLMDAHLEIIRLSDQLENKRRFITRFFDFINSIASTLDSQKVYEAALAKCSEIMKAQRSSLMILNPQSNELELIAAIGFDTDPAQPIRVKVGEGVAGRALSSGSALIVRDLDTDARAQSAGAGRYKTKSFISFPLTIGSRKIGVLNLTERSDGLAYENEDLSLLEIMAPHLALIIERTEWHRKADSYQRMSLTDPLTGLPNRRYLEDRLFEEVERSKRHGTALSFMIIDVDRFKDYNDIYGHRNGDLVLVKTAQMLRGSVRAIDMSARFAGDEFCMVLPETEAVGAARIAERLRDKVSQTEFPSEQGELMGKVTISIGVSCFGPSQQSPRAIIETADRALYKAKTQGRDRVVVYEDAGDTVEP